MNDTKPDPAERVAEPFRRVALLINPASGKDRPILAPVNRALSQLGVGWQAYVMQRGGEKEALARALSAEPDALLVCGGDGTFSIVASALLQLGASEQLLTTLGGGTADALAETLGIPSDIEQAVTLICSGSYECVSTDVGMVGERAFLLRASIGATAGLTDKTTREEKDRLGLLAYALSGYRTLGETIPQRYRLVVDGAKTEHDAISVVVANASSIGVGATLGSEVRESDQLLDVYVVPNVGWVTRALANAALGEGLMHGATHLRGRSISVDCDIPVNVHLDGESIGETPVAITLRPRALQLLHVLSPRPG